MRSGLIARKVGMTRIFSDKGHWYGVTVLGISENKVVQRREGGRDGYTALQVGSESKKKVDRALGGHYKRCGIEAKARLREFRVDEGSLLEEGESLDVGHFSEGQHVDVRGISKGKGFAGVMKRHNFHGLRASHGVSKSHRSGGSTGQCQDPGKVFKGRKMAGQMGNEQVCVQNLCIVKVDAENQLLYVKGSVPGATGSWLSVTDAIKKVKAGVK